VRDHLILRTEAATSNVTDYGVNKAVGHLPALREKLAAINDNYLDIQQDILETFVDRGQLQERAKPALTASGKRIPGLKLDNPRQLALMHALVRFAQIAAPGTFSTGEIRPHVVAALGSAAERYGLASLRYDLSKLRANGLVEKLHRSRRLSLTRQGIFDLLDLLKAVRPALRSPCRRSPRSHSRRRRPPLTKAIAARPPLPAPQRRSRPPRAPSASHPGRPTRTKFPSVPP
jgi:hypothetical protein